MLADQGEQFRVSPVKATAVMVAVAVVGGILVFAASQWFFGQQAPAQALTIMGYDATGGCLQDHAGDQLPCETGAEDDGGLSAGDTLALYVHNAGSEPLQITLIEIAGVVYFPGTSGAAGTFELLGESSVEAGTDGTILVRFAGSDIEGGNVVTVIVEAGDEIATAPAVIGERTG
jgi:hypothetical protein